MPDPRKWEAAHDIQAYFTAFTLLHEVSPAKQYGIDRANLRSEIANLMGMEVTHAMPSWYKAVHRATIEIGANPRGFFLNLAEAYLDWLYAKNTTKDCDGPSHDS